ncbi:stage V sporulation protein AA [Senegalia massiliensis]|uniref:stage V sporulation protein AA n=1 Tax=Senegalia massiliensis TaxID=1720316 RepID=UPI00102FB855|nr:stage V sporulation protein AA [Senegalia massiliensis]
MNLELFLQVEPKVTIKPNTQIKIKHIASVFCKDSKLEQEIKELIIAETNDFDNNKVISVLSIIKNIKNINNNINIVIHGSPEILIHIKDYKKENNLYKFLKVFTVSILLFFGASIAIINFHDDVNMEESLSTINYIVTGVEKQNPLILTIPYSLGLGVGMVAFFQRVFKKKKKNEPSPLQLEMHSYEKNIDDYILDVTKHNSD